MPKFGVAKPSKFPRFCQFYPNSATFSPKMAQILPILPHFLEFCQFCQNATFKFPLPMAAKILPNGSEFCHLATLGETNPYPPPYAQDWPRDSILYCNLHMHILFSFTTYNGSFRLSKPRLSLTRQYLISVCKIKTVKSIWNPFGKFTSVKCNLMNNESSRRWLLLKPVSTLLNWHD